MSDFIGPAEGSVEKQAEAEYHDSNQTNPKKSPE